jgi:hypothetical protein
MMRGRRPLGADERHVMLHHAFNSTATKRQTIKPQTQRSDFRGNAAVQAAPAV